MEDRKIGFDLITLGHIIKRERDRANDQLKEKILGPNNNVMCTDLGIINFLANNTDKEVYQKDIEQHFSLTAPSVSNKLRDLEKKSLINRVYSKVDTRLKQVTMTEVAKDIDDKMREDIRSFEERINSVMTEDEKDQLLIIIDKLKAEFE